MVVVLEGGSVINMPWLDSVPAVVMAWYPGQVGGTALGRLLFGDVNFSGKLPITWAASESDLPHVREHQRDDRRWTTTSATATSTTQGKTPLRSFGYGLSYTTFTYSNLQVPCSTVAKDGTVNVTVDVANNSAVAGDEVVFLFVSYPSTHGAPAGQGAQGLQARLARRQGNERRCGARDHPVAREGSEVLEHARTSAWQVESGTVKVIVAPSAAAASDRAAPAPAAPAALSAIRSW